MVKMDDPADEAGRCPTCGALVTPDERFGTAWLEEPTLGVKEETATCLTCRTELFRVPGARRWMTRSYGRPIR